MIPRAIAIVIVACACAAARTPDGVLGALRLPNNTRPAIAQEGAAFEIEARQAGALRLIGGAAEYALAPTWTTTPNGAARTAVTLPAEVPAGTYALEWSHDGESDRNERAVFVVARDEQTDSPSRQYAFACAAFPPDGETAASVRAVEALDPAHVQFVFAFVPGTEDRYPEIIAALDACPLPTIAIAAASSSVCERWFGPATFAFCIGPDVFIAPADGRAGIGDTIGAAPGELARLRHAAASARWTIGLFAAPPTDMSMRNETTLFVDNPFPLSIIGPTTGDAPPFRAPAWAGWFDAPRAVTLSPGNATVFAATRRGVSAQKMAPVTAPKR